MNIVIDEKYRTLPVIFEVENEITSDDDRFLKVKIWLMHLGLNANDCYFEKSVVEDAIPTLEYIPIVGFIEQKYDGDKDFKGHQYILTKKNGKYVKKYLGSAYGVIMSDEDNNAHFETRICDDGIEREFLVVDGLMWKQFDDAVDIMTQDVIKGQSMELLDKPDAVEGYEDENGVFHFTKFTFKGACILGDDVMPAMTNATIETVFTVHEFVSQIQNEISEKVLTFSKYLKEQQGGVTMPNENAQQVATDFELTVKQLWEEISVLVQAQETIEDDWGWKYARYCLVDIQQNEIIVIDRSDSYRIFGLTYTKNADDVVIDWSTKKKKKIEYADWNEGEGETATDTVYDFNQEIKNIEEFAQQKIDVANDRATEFENASKDFEAKFNDIDGKYKEMEPKYNAFVAANEKAEAEKLDNEKLDIFSKYESVLSNDEKVKLTFQEYKENRKDMTPEEIEGKCAVLYAQVNLFSDTKKQDNLTATVFTRQNDEQGLQHNSRYGVIYKNN